MEFDPNSGSHIGLISLVFHRLQIGALDFTIEDFARRKETVTMP